MKAVFLRWIWACPAFLLAACATSPFTKPTLYERLGGEPVVTRVVNETIDRAATDPRCSDRNRASCCRAKMPFR